MAYLFGWLWNTERDDTETSFQGDGEPVDPPSRAHGDFDARDFDPRDFYIYTED